ncbi:MAG: hypothetical protein DMG21_17960 [Acidobacteria bacterium]|nr:MAG: hypothetical protein DMG21_17960 [Acidobacteriota bacterium]
MSFVERSRLAMSTSERRWAIIFCGSIRTETSRMSLGGLAIAIGLIIDDAVVIIENIYRHLGMGESVEEASEKGTRELLGPVIGSTATTVVVFSPLTLLSGVVGEFFRALCLTLAVSVILSLVFALTLIPLLSEQLLSRELHREASAHFIAPVTRAYERLVRWSLRFRVVVLAGAVASLGLAYFLYTRVEQGFLPEMDEGGFVLDTIAPPGSSLPETNLLNQKAEAVVLADKEKSSPSSNRAPSAPTTSTPSWTISGKRSLPRFPASTSNSPRSFRT